jgi:CubicO group peptidase (beta-lactamase class C family)
MTLSGFVGEPTPAGAIDARSNFLRPAMLNQGAWPKGAGDLISTTADMARWNIALMSGRVIAAPLLETMLTPVAPGTDSKPYHGCLYAMGWYVCDRPGYRLHQARRRHQRLHGIECDWPHQGWIVDECYFLGEL